MNSNIIKILFLAIITVILPVEALAASPGAAAVSAPHVVILGDSNTSIGGDMCDNPKGWNKWFAEQFDSKSCRSYARSGATWTHTKSTRRNPEQNTGRLADDNVVFNQIVRLIEAYNSGKQPAPDLVLIAAGTNDAWFDTKRPGLLSRTASDALNIVTTDSVSRHDPASLTSLAEAVVYDCMMLCEVFPETRIIILTPMQSTQISADKLERVTGVLEDCSAALGIAVIRQDKELPIRSEDEKVKFRYTYDGTHTSVAGAKENGTILAQRIRELLATQ